MNALGHIVVKETRKTIISNPAGWSPLSKRHLNYKRQGGFRLKIYLMTKSLYTSLNHEVSKSNKGYSLKVGFPKTAHPTTSTPLHRIARDMEYGRRNLPARPLLSYSTPKAVKVFLNSKYTPDKLFDKKAKILIKKASGSISTYRTP